MHAMKIHQLFQKIIKYKAFSIKMLPHSSCVKVGATEQVFAYCKQSRICEMHRNHHHGQSVAVKTRTCYSPTCLVSNTFTVTTLRAPPVLTTPTHSQGLPLPPHGPVPLAGVVGWALNARLCRHPPRVPSSCPALGPTNPCVAPTVLSFGR